MKGKTEKKYLAFISLGIFCFLLAALALFIHFDQVTTGMMLSVSLIIIGLIFLVLGIHRGIKQKPNYRTLFYVGIIWAIISLPLNNYVLTALGAICIIIGLINKDKWQTTKTCADLSKKQKWTVSIFIGLSIAALITFIIIYFLSKGGVLSCSK
jgi:hypothetical protein